MLRWTMRIVKLGPPSEGGNGRVLRLPTAGGLQGAFFACSGEEDSPVDHPFRPDSGDAGHPTLRLASNLEKGAAGQLLASALMSDSPLLGDPMKICAGRRISGVRAGRGSQAEERTLALISIPGTPALHERLLNFATTEGLPYAPDRDSGR